MPRFQDQRFQNLSGKDLTLSTSGKLQATFQPSSLTDSDSKWTVTLNSNQRANSANCSQIAEGGPIDPKIKAVLTVGSAANCNELASLGGAAKPTESDPMDDSSTLV